MNNNRLFIAIVISILLPACRNNQPVNTIRVQPDILDAPYAKITDLQPGDILVKPNHNWLPGTSWVMGGKGFGHAVIVIEGASDTCVVNLLKKTVIFESQARDVEPGYQLRKAPAYCPGTDFNVANVNFGNQSSPFRYRLRPNLTEKQCKAIIDYITAKDDGLSCWRALKKTGNQEGEYQDKKYWYCSLLIWQAFYDVLEIDLDANAGNMAYPNDLISSPFFNNNGQQKENRVRF